MDIWIYGYMDKLIYFWHRCVFYIRGFKYHRGLKYEYIDIWIYDYIDIWIYAFRRDLYIWGFKYLMGLIYGYMGIWIYLYMDMYVNLDILFKEYIEILVYCHLDIYWDRHIWIYLIYKYKDICITGYMDFLCFIGPKCLSHLNMYKSIYIHQSSHNCLNCFKKYLHF